MFKLSPGFIDQYKDKQPSWGYNGLGYVVYKRSYARPIGDTTEEFWQTCQRVVEGTFELQRRHVELMRTRWNAHKAQKSAQEMFRLMWEFKFLPPGRGLWAMGTPLVMERNNGAALLNCGFCSTEEIDSDFAAPFCFLFEASAHGVGVGFDTRGAGKVSILTPKVSSDTFVVEDSREGWSDLLRRILQAYVGKNTLPVSIDYSKVRPFGAPIKTFGGTASGPDALRDLIEKDIPSILTTGLITSSQIVDVMNVIGKCVVAGGARRSSEIALGDINDEEFMKLKLDKEKLYSHRWNSNNTVLVPEGYNHFERFVDPIMENGEPGFYFLHNAQKYGRMKDGVNNLDKKALGVNPCGEQTLESYELCNIAETFPANCSSFEEYMTAVKYAYLYTKTVTLVQTPWPRTNEIMLRNRRIGLSMSGIIQNINKLGFAEHIRWCDEAYKYIQHLDTVYSEWLCIRPSIKTSTVKPSGSVSLLTGATPGIHYPHSEYYLRRVRFTKNSPMLPLLQKSNYPIEQDLYDKNSLVVSFPVKEAYYVRGKKDINIWEQLENAAQMQAHWSDNSVSITVEIKEHEKDQLAQALSRYQSRLKSVSFLPPGHSYEQAPYEEITEQEYNRLISKITPLDLNESDHEVTDKFCDSDVCQI